jgi:ribosome-associated protein
VSTPESGAVDSHARAIAAAEAAADKKANEVLVLDVGDILGITEAFVVASASNSRQVKAIVDEVEEQVRVLHGSTPLSVEGLDDAGWVLMDYGDFVVHVFLDDTREFYALERLWSDAPTIWREIDAPAV